MRKSTITISGIIVTLLALVSCENKLEAGTGHGPEPGVNPMLQVTYQPSHAIGIRTIGTTGLTYKHYNNRGGAFEAILGLGNNFVSLTALSEKYNHAFDSRYVRSYYGLGGHVAIQSGSGVSIERNRFESQDDEFGLGVDFILGLEAIIPGTPLAVSLDVKPFVEVTTSGNAYFGLDPGLGIKVIF